MMKFFRKNMRALLAIFMSLLLVVWLGSDALMSLLDPQRDRRANPVRGEAFGKPVKLNDMVGTFSQLELLKALGVPWQALWIYPVSAFAPNQYYQYMLAGQIRDVQKHPLDEDEWYMLDLEARNRRVFVPQEEVDRFKQQMNLPPQAVAGILKRYQVTMRDIDQAIQSFVRVLRFVEQASQGVQVSEADIQDHVRQLHEKVKVNVVVLEAAKFIDEKYQPTAEEMEELFAKGKDKDPVPGSMTEFGYRQPELTQIEYIQVHQAELARLQQVRDDEAFDYWSGHKGEFLKPSTRPAEAAATQPREERQPYATFTEAKALVIEKLRTDRAKNEALRIARDLIAQLGREWTNAATTQPGCKEPPAGAKSDTLYAGMVDSVGRRFPGTLKYARTALTDQTGMGMNPEIGRASAFAGTRPVPFGTVAFEVCVLKTEVDKESDLARLRRNVYETCAEPVVDSAGNAYVFRNVAASPKQAPPSWESVREQLAQDVRKIRANAEAERLAKALAEQAGRTTLRKAYDDDAALKAKLGEAAYQSPEAFARKMGWQMETFPGTIPGIGGDAKLVDTCFELVGENAQANRVKAGPLVGRGWIVVEGLEILPVNQAEYDEQRNMAMAMLQIKRQVEFLRNWFDPAQIKQRVGWKDAEPEREGDKAEGEPAGKPEPTSEPAAEQKQS